MKKIISDCDGVLLDWSFAYNVWMYEQGYERVPDTDRYFDNYKRYGISEERALNTIKEFNESGALGFIPAYKDSVEYVNKFVKEGWRFDVISMIGADKYAQSLREQNLKHLFGDIFDFIYCAGDFRKPKKQILEERYKGLNYIWLEDRVDYAQQGDEVGLKTFIFDHPYNKGYGGRRVKNWSELYDATH
jgi:FMN phosphatase YigB (HAD superfamily)